MKFTKMSLVAALLIGSSAFAIENVKVSGDANLYYSTTDTQSGYAALSKKEDLFSKDNSAADAGVNLNVTADLAKNDLVTVSAGAGYTVLSTLGLENNFVSNVWGGAHTATVPTDANFGSPLGGAKVENANWMNEAWVALSLNKSSKTTLKLGRMELDTPLAFTEEWSIEKNTFEAAVVVNQDVPGTTLVGAYVGNGNGTETFGENAQSNVQELRFALAPVVNANGKFTTFGTNGAYAVGVINNSFKPVTAQAWYYELIGLATAYWLQADLDATDLGVKGLIAGAQYTSTEVKDKDSSGTFAVMAGYELKDLVTVKLAYSQTSDEDTLHGGNTAVADGESKLYTEAWWNYGEVTQKDTSAINLTVESPVNGMFDLGVYLTAVYHNDANSPFEAALTAKKSFGPLDATVAYIYFDEDKDGVDASNTVQAYLTLNF